MFGPLFVASGSTDRDSDGSMDWQEAVTGTDALNPDDFFKVNRCRAVPGKYPQFGYPWGVALDWITAPGRTYTVYYATNLHSLNTIWQPLDLVMGTGSPVSTTNFWPSAAECYRVEVESESAP